MRADIWSATYVDWLEDLGLNFPAWQVGNWDGMGLEARKQSHLVLGHPDLVLHPKNSTDKTIQIYSKTFQIMIMFQFMIMIYNGTPLTGENVVADRREPGLPGAGNHCCPSTRRRPRGGCTLWLAAGVGGWALYFFHLHRKNSLIQVYTSPWQG